MCSHVPICALVSSYSRWFNSLFISSTKKGRRPALLTALSPAPSTEPGPEKGPGNDFSSESVSAALAGSARHRPPGAWQAGHPFSELTAGKGFQDDEC